MINSAGMNIRRSKGERPALRLSRWPKMIRPLLFHRQRTETALPTAKPNRICHGFARTTWKVWLDRDNLAARSACSEAGERGGVSPMVLTLILR